MKKLLYVLCLAALAQPLVAREKAVANAQCVNVYDGPASDSTKAGLAGRQRAVPAFNNYFNVHLTKLLVHQVQITYGRKLSGRWALEGEVGAKWRWPLCKDAYELEPNSLLDFTEDLIGSRAMHNMPFSNSYYACLWATHYLPPNRTRVQPYLRWVFFFGTATTKTSP